MNSWIYTKMASHWAQDHVIGNFKVELTLPLIHLIFSLLLEMYFYTAEAA